MDPAVPTRPIRASSAGRILDYVEHQFPLLVYLPSGLASFLSIHLALQAMAGVTPLRLTWVMAAGALTVVLFTLLLRVNDELKDADHDRRLAAEGDARYTGRPIVTGHVREDDLVRFRVGIIAVLVAVNVWLGWPWAVVGFLTALAVVLASARFFFWPRIQTNLLLAFVTHNPIALVVGAYVVGVYAAEFGIHELGWNALGPVIAGWLPIAAWETSRKVRIPSEETSYQTYSKLLGWKVAAWVPAGFALLGALAALWVARETALSWVFAAVLVLATAGVVFASARFRFRPTSQTAKLQPYSEVFAVVVTVGLVVALIARWGVRWTG